MKVLGLRSEDLENCKQIVRTLYKNPKGEPFEMTDGQAILFASIYMRLHPRMGFLTYTQYGKSDIVSMAILTRITTFAERWLLIGGSADKAKIIMNKLIDHIFDNEYTKSKLTMKNVSHIERLRHEKSRTRITFHAEEGRVGEVSVLSGDSSKKGESAGDILVGHGAANVVCIPEGFSVRTPKGDIEISKLVKDKEVDTVYSYNHKDNKIEEQKILNYQENKLQGDLIEIDLGDRNFVCTEEHPVWVIGKGYVPAKDIQLNDECIVYDN